MDAAVQRFLEVVGQTDDISTFTFLNQLQRKAH